MQQKFNHEAKTMHEALGIERDLLEEIEFKAKQLVENYETKSETLEKGLAWVAERFQSNQAIISALLFSAIGTATSEKKIEAALSMLKAGKPQQISVDSEEKLEQIKEELEKLVSEYGGELKHSESGSCIVIKFEDEETKNEFNSKLDSIRSKYSDDDLPMAPFGGFGPVAEA